jgi:hypothetical protein
MAVDNNELCFAFSFDEPNWRRFPQKKHEELGLVGNELWGNKSAKAGALVCSPSSKYPEIAVSQSGLEYLNAALQRGAITWGVVVFYKWNGRKRDIIESLDVIDVATKLKNIPPRDGRFGSYWWWNQNGTPYEDDDVPF